MTLIEDYNAAIQRGDIQEDAIQRQLLIPLQQLADEMTSKPKWYQLLSHKPIKGLYLLGSVGVGKTYLMDLFYRYLPERRKKRVHFLSFMQQIDQKLRFLQGHRDPVLTIATELAKDCRVLCLDEFIVDDITQAMILVKLLPALFAKKVVLVTTSNTALDNLYQNGVNRERFLPVLALLRQQCEEIAIRSSMDYRIGRSPELNAYLYPVSLPNQHLFEQQFHLLAGKDIDERPITIQQRLIPIVKSGQGVIWFEFDVVCAMPRCQLDYIELADHFHTICVSNLPVLSQLLNNTAVVLFIQLVDVLYDRGVRLILSAAVKASDLYQEGPLMTEFARTLSRLEEMQSIDYVTRRCVLPKSN